MGYKMITVHRASDDALLEFECFDTEEGFKQFCDWLAIGQEDCQFTVKEHTAEEFKALFEKENDEPVATCLNYPHEWFMREAPENGDPPQESVVEYYATLLEYGRDAGLGKISESVRNGTIDQLGTDGNDDSGT